MEVICSTVQFCCMIKPLALYYAENCSVEPLAKVRFQLYDGSDCDAGVFEPAPQLTYLGGVPLTSTELSESTPAEFVAAVPSHILGV